MSARPGARPDRAIIRGHRRRWIISGSAGAALATALLIYLVSDDEPLQLASRRGASTVEVRVKVGGVTVDADHVFIGADGHHPDAVPTSVGRA